MDLGRLSKTEAEVMRTIWRQELPITVSALLRIFAEEKNWKTTTISTLLSRLINKGFLVKTLRGKVNYYDAVLSEDEYLKHETKTFLQDNHNGSVRSFVAALSDAGELSEDDILELKEWFREKAGGV